MYLVKLISFSESERKNDGVVPDEAAVWVKVILGLMAAQQSPIKLLEITFWMYYTCISSSTVEKDLS